MSQSQSEDAGRQGYDPGQDPDADPEMLTSREIADQPDQAEGEPTDAEGQSADELEDPSS